jgi:hypothetical protein
MSKQPSQNSSESKPTSKPEPSGLEAFAEALKQGGTVEVPEGEHQTEAEPVEKPAKKVKPKDFAQLAEVLGIDAKDLYDIQVPSSVEGAEPFTLGKLKDLAKDHDDFAVRTLEHDEKVRKTQTEFMRAEQELRELFAALPPDAIKPEVRAKLQAKRDKALTEERQRVLDAIPEWKDATLRASELEAMDEHLKNYGFPASYLASVFDHRTLRYIRANWQREEQIRRALEKVAERRPSTPPKSQGSRPVTKSQQRGPVSKEQQQASRFAQQILNFQR